MSMTILSTVIVCNIRQMFNPLPLYASTCVYVYVCAYAYAYAHTYVYVSLYYYQCHTFKTSMINVFTATLDKSGSRNTVLLFQVTCYNVILARLYICHQRNQVHIDNQCINNSYNIESKNIIDSLLPTVKYAYIFYLLQLFVHKVSFLFLLNIIFILCCSLMTIPLFTYKDAGIQAL